MRNIVKNLYFHHNFLCDDKKNDYLRYIHCQLTQMSDDKDYLLTELGVVGGNIEGYIPSKFCKRWAATCTVIDVPVRHGATTSRLDGSVLTDFAAITVAHQNAPDFESTLKESIVKEFDQETFFQQQLGIIDYYRNNSESFHVHVHRGAGMGKKHIQTLQRKLKDCDGISFGFGYTHDQLDPKIEDLDVYYSVSLIVGFKSDVNSGETYVPTTFTKLSEGIYYPNPRTVIYNDLIDTLPYINAPMFKGTNVTVAMLDGIYNPTPETTVKINRQVNF